MLTIRRKHCYNRATQQPIKTLLMDIAVMITKFISNQIARDILLEIFYKILAVPNFLYLFSDNNYGKNVQYFVFLYYISSLLGKYFCHMMVI